MVSKQVTNLVYHAMSENQISNSSTIVVSHLVITTRGVSSATLGQYQPRIFFNSFPHVTLPTPDPSQPNFSTITTSIDMTLSLSPMLPQTLPQISIRNFTSMVNIKLNDDNFLLWKSQLESILLIYDLLSYVDGSFVCPPKQVKDSNDNLIINPLYTAWVRSNQFV